MSERCAPPPNLQFEVFNPGPQEWKPAGHFPPCMARQLRDQMREVAPDLMFRFRSTKTGELVDSDDL